jgi:hypothetical protein
MYREPEETHTRLVMGMSPGSRNTDTVHCVKYSPYQNRRKINVEGEVLLTCLSHAQFFCSMRHFLPKSLKFDFKFLYGTRQREAAYLRVTVLHDKNSWNQAPLTRPFHGISILPSFSRLLMTITMNEFSHLPYLMCKKNFNVSLSVKMLPVDFKCCAAKQTENRKQSHSGTTFSISLWRMNQWVHKF